MDKKTYNRLYQLDPFRTKAIEVLNSENKQKPFETFVDDLIKSINEHYFNPVNRKDQ